MLQICCFFNVLCHLAYAEFLFLCLFVFEMGIRMYALGLAAYFNSAFNRYTRTHQGYTFG